MLILEVKDMTCGHCVGVITKAVQAADAHATVRIDLPTHRVEIEPGRAGAAEIVKAIEEAGYTPVAV